MDTVEFQEEKELLLALQARDPNDFLYLYREYTEDLLLYTYLLLQDGPLAKYKVSIRFQ